MKVKLVSRKIVIDAKNETINYQSIKDEFTISNSCPISNCLFLDKNFSFHEVPLSIFPAIYRTEFNGGNCFSVYQCANIYPELVICSLKLPIKRN